MEVFKTKFTQKEIDELRSLIRERCKADKSKQKRIRDKMRNIGFYGGKCFGIKDMTISKFEELLLSGSIEVQEGQTVMRNVKNVSNKVENNCKCFEPLIDSDSKILVLGTMPGEKSLETGEYYASTNNSFWKIIRDLFNGGKDFNGYEEKCDCLKKNGIALWDVLAACEREGSLDENIKNEVPNDIVGLLEKYPNVERIIFNGNKPQDKITQCVHCNCVVATSTSGANTSKSYEEKLAIWKSLLM